MTKTKKAAARRTSNLQQDGKISKQNIKLLEKLYTQGKAAYGSARNLQKESKLPRYQVEKFLQSVNAHTKYKTFRKNFPRLKVLAYDINEIWSADLAYVDKLAKYNDGVKYLLVVVDVLSRYLRVEKLKTKQATETAKAFQRMLRTKQPQKVWVDKGTEFKSSFNQLCKNRGIEIYNTESDTKSAFAERNIRSLKNIIYKYLEKNTDTWTN